MPTMLMLKQFAEQNNNSSVLILINKYIVQTSENWTKGKYYLGGQLALNLEDDITNEHIDFVKNKNESCGGPCNSWEQASMCQAFGEIVQFEELFNNYLNDIRNEASSGKL